MSKTQLKNRRVALILLAIVIGMFGFGYVLIPMYNAMARVYGFGGQLQTEEASKAQEQQKVQHALRVGVDSSRILTMQFMVTVNTSLDLDFHPLTHQLMLSPGQIKEVKYFVKNLSDKEVILQGIPTISPDTAARYVARARCFCFSKQMLKPGEAKELTVQFVVDPDIPRTIQVLTLSYRFIAVKSVVTSDQALVMHKS